MKWKFLNSGVNSGRFNMDFDLFLAENAQPETAYLRLYQWHPYCISLGANQSEDEIDLKKTKYDMIDVVKRPTGGRAILHSMELTYSVIYPINENTSAKNLYNKINLALRKGLIFFDPKLNDIELEHNQPDFKQFYKSDISAVCFAVSARSELNLYGKKLVGSAQRKLGKVILQHGSILGGSFHQNIVEYLKFDDHRKKEMLNEIKSTTIDLRNALKKEIDYAKLSQSIRKGFEEHFNCTFEETEQTELEISLIA